MNLSYKMLLCLTNSSAQIVTSEFVSETPIKRQSTRDKGSVSDIYGPVDFECLFAPLQPAGYTKA